MGKTVKNILHIPQGSLIFRGYHLLFFLMLLAFGAWSKLIWPDSKVCFETYLSSSLTMILGRGRRVPFIFIEDLLGSAREIT